MDTVTFYKDDYNRWQEFDVTSSAQAMVNGTKSNYGWIIKWNYDWGGGVDAGALFYSSDYTTDVTKRPFLEVTYQVDPLVSFDYD
ncbi:MAG: DNRLRE domain-containing protein, partial [Gammaproteobacteria bacterium]|nr:DNRLRE domain-containing protein [Gammaproteobacteria bacterium]NIT06294.1 DNRLRE domain-containing protein [Gammaproteobacteria bacterium]NIT40884.1 DNRLRE domain-containing protein [Gammaproteobacteria bacterium]